MSLTESSSEELSSEESDRGDDEMVADFRNWASAPPQSSGKPLQDFLRVGPASDEVVDLFFFVGLFITLFELLVPAGDGVVVTPALRNTSLRFDGDIDFR